MVELIGYLFTIDAIVTWGLASLVYKFGLGKTDPKANLLFRLCCVSLATFLFSLLFGSYAFFSSLTASDILGYLIACLISGLCVTIGDLMYFISLQKIDASRAYPLTQLSLIFVYPFAFFLFGEKITPAILFGGALILSSLFLLSSKDKPKNTTLNNEQERSKNNSFDGNKTPDKNPEYLFVGVMLALGTAFLWAIAIIAFTQARIVSGDVFVTNFVRVAFGAVFVAILGIFKREYYAGFRKENRDKLKYYAYIGTAGSLSLGLADSFFYKAAEINGLVLTSTFTANTPMVQQLFSILLLKEKFRKRFLIAVVLIVLGNYIILFM